MILFGPNPAENAQVDILWGQQILITWVKWGLECTYTAAKYWKILAAAQNTSCYKILITGAKWSRQRKLQRPLGIWATAPPPTDPSSKAPF